MKYFILYSVAIILFSCSSIDTSESADCEQKAFILLEPYSSNKLYSSFVVEGSGKKLKYCYLFTKYHDTIKQGSKVIKLEIINDSTVLVKTFLKEEDLLRVTGNMGMFDIDRISVENAAYQKFIHQIYGKAWGYD